MALSSINPRPELGPGASFTFSHRNGIWPTYSLTRASISASVSLIASLSAFSLRAASPADPATPHDSGSGMLFRLARATPLEQPKDRPSMVTETGLGAAPVLREPAPQRTSGTVLQPMGTDANDPWPSPCA